MVERSGSMFPDLHHFNLRGAARHSRNVCHPAQPSRAPRRQISPAFPKSRATVQKGATSPASTPIARLNPPPGHSLTDPNSIQLKVIVMSDAKIAELEKKIVALTTHVTRLEDVQEIRKVQHKYGYYIDKCLYPCPSFLFPPPTSR